MDDNKEYYAFISYKSEDVEWAIWLQHELEHYHLPASYNGRTDIRQKLRPVFRDIDELSAGNLPEQIKRALENSQNLIVVCSPQAAASPWVNQEVETFISLGRTDRIFPFIVEGDTPKEFFPPALLNLPQMEDMDGLNVAKNGRDYAFIKLISAMISATEFSILWDKYEREKELTKQQELKIQSLVMQDGYNEIKSNDSKGIFISYKRKDKEIVFKLKDYIEQNVGVNCWIDLDGIESDAQFANVIIKAINNAQVFLFMYSRSHTEIKDYDNDWTVREINFAQKKKKRIVFVNIDGSPLTDWFELMFGTKQQIDASSESTMYKLCEDMKEWLNPNKSIQEIIRVIEMVDLEVGELSLEVDSRGLYGYCNSKGEQIIPNQWQNAWGFSAGLARVRDERGFIGYINKRGCLIIDYKWIDAKDFSEGKAAVKNSDGRWGYIDLTGSIIIPCTWRNAWGFNDHVARVQDEGGKRWYIDKNGHVVGAAKYHI